jgi:hypothetical protein
MELHGNTLATSAGEPAPRIAVAVTRSAIALRGSARPPPHRENYSLRAWRRGRVLSMVG